MKKKLLAAALLLALLVPGKALAEDPAAQQEFKRCDSIMFYDSFSSEALGATPSKWDVLEGKAVVRTLEGVNALEITENGLITPHFKRQGAYLPAEFSIEYEFFYWDYKEEIGVNDLKLVLANMLEREDNPLAPSDHAFALVHAVCMGDTRNYFEYNDGTVIDAVDKEIKLSLKQGWHHVALSYKKPAVKVYLDGKCIVSLPKIQRPTWFCFQVPFDYEDLTYIRNVVLAWNVTDTE